MNRANSLDYLPKVRGIEDSTDLKRRIRQLRYLAFNLLAHRRYRKRIEELFDRGLAVNDVFQRYKYLGDYLARSFNRQTRLAMILSHYRLAEARVSRTAIRSIIMGGVPLWDYSFDDHRAVIRLTTSQLAPMEGEWQLQFVLDEAIICTLSFLFVSVPPFAPDGEFACLIGGVQGGYDCRMAIRTAAKGHDEIAPATMLVLAVKAVARALDVEAVFGVSSQQQIVGLYAADRIKADYDAIWISEGASIQVDGFYALSRDLVERDLSNIPRSHRRRTKQKRQRKVAILAALTAAARSALKPTTNASL